MYENRDSHLAAASDQPAQQLSGYALRHTQRHCRDLRSAPGQCSSMKNVVQIFGGSMNCPKGGRKISSITCFIPCALRPPPLVGCPESRAACPVRFFGSIDPTERERERERQGLWGVDFLFHLPPPSISRFTVIISRGQAGQRFSCSWSGSRRRPAASRAASRRCCWPRRRCGSPSWKPL